MSGGDAPGMYILVRISLRFDPFERIRPSRAISEVMLYATLIALGFASWVLRARQIRTLERESRGTRVFAADGVAVGAAGIELPLSDAPAVLLLHGGGDTPQSLAELAAYLHARGFAVSAPLLPGHGRTIRDFAKVRAAEFSRAAADAYDALRAGHDVVHVAGLSMGGALAVQLASEHPEVPALVLLAPYLSMPPKIERAARTAWLWGAIMPFVRSGEGISVLDPEQRSRSLAYGVFSAPALRALYDTARRAFAVLPRVSSPTLMIQSRGDNRISVAAAERAFARLGASEKRLEWVTGAAHVITVDFGRERVFALVCDWFEAHPGVARRTAREN